MSIFQLQSGELLQSYFFRIKNSSGEGIEQSILDLMIARDGAISWKNFSPLFLPDVLNKSVIDTAMSVENILRNHTLASLYIPTLTEDLYVRMIDCYLTRIDDRNQHVTKVINSMLPVQHEFKFCSDCFCDQIYERGFHWFKVEWCLPRTNYCDVHKKNLKILRCSNCGYTQDRRADVLRYVQKGKCRLCGASIFDSHSFDDCESIYRIREPDNISDTDLMNKMYPVFDADVKRMLIQHSLFIIEQKTKLRHNQKPLIMVTINKVERKKLNDFLKGKVSFVPKNAFWQCVATGFGNLTEFDKYLNGNTYIEKMTSKDIVADVSQQFEVSMYKPKK